MMAETVKKSRIVSDDDLEESLMQEFNMRLKTCLSSEGLNDDEDDEEEDEESKHYENVQVVRPIPTTINYSTTTTTTNGNHSHRQEQLMPELVHPDETTMMAEQAECALSARNKLDSVEEFIQIERECLSLEVTPPQSEPELSSNGMVVRTPPDNEEEPEAEGEYKPLRCFPQIQNIDLTKEVELDKPEIISAKDRMLLSTDSASCLLFTQTVTSPMLTPSDERVDFMKGFTQAGEAGDSAETSPPTTVSEDPYQVQDHFEQVEVQSDSPGHSEETPQVNRQDNIELPEVQGNIEESEQIPESTEDSEDQEQEVDQDQDQDPTEPEVDQDQHDAEVDQPEVDQLMEDYPEEEELVEEPEVDQVQNHIQISPQESLHNSSQNPEQDMIQNLQNEEEEEDEVDRSEVQKSPDLLRDVPEKVSNVPTIQVTIPKRGDLPVEAKISNYERDITSPNSRPLSATPTDLDCKLPSLKSLKDQYIKTANTEATTPTSPKFEKAEMTTMKSLDIMKQISKFEQISPAEESTEVTETSSYVETTTVVESVNGEGGGHVQEAQQVQVQKKKTKKKSRSHANEKENISVCDLDSRFYNVNVKSLCRSFGDLTKLPEENHRPEANNKSRAKSMNDIRAVGIGVGGRPPHHRIENVFNGVSVKALKERFLANNNCMPPPPPSKTTSEQKSSFSKFDALQKKNVMHIRSSDSSKAQEKFNGSQPDTSNCKSCGKIVFQMEQMKAERSIWHKNCFRCTECNKQLTVDTYQSHEGTLYCKPHFKALFAPKAVEEDPAPPSDKPSLGLEELQSLNVKERFQVFEQHGSQEEEHGLERMNVKRSPSILSKLARFQAKGMDIGVGDESLNGIPIEESSTEDEHELDGDEEEDDEDADLVRAKRAQREKPFHFTGMSDVKNKWEHGEQNGRDERREERKQEIQNIRNRLFMGKQGKMKEMYQQAVMESESGANVKRTETIEKSDTRSIKERFEKGEVDEIKTRAAGEDEEVFESEISKKSRSIFKELDANATKAPPMIPAQKSASKIFNRQASNASECSTEVVKSTAQQEDVTVQTAAIQQRFKFFETYREPEVERKRFRITPPRDGQVKMDSPDREVYRDPEVVRAEELQAQEDSVVAVKTQTAKKMLNKFRQMEEEVGREHVPMGPKPLKRFTPPPEPIRSASESEEEASESMDEEDDEEPERNGGSTDGDLMEAQKAARAKQLRAKFEKWEANEIKREQNNSSVNIAGEFGEEQSQIESTKSLRARFESMKGQQREEAKVPRPKVNRFVNSNATLESCTDCQKRVYPLEKISVHGAIYHKKCFKCMECNAILRMDSYSYNQGRLYCTPHFKRLFITKGNYDTAFGLEQHKEKWNASVA